MLLVSSEPGKSEGALGVVSLEDVIEVGHRSRGQSMS